MLRKHLVLFSFCSLCARSLRAYITINNFSVHFVLGYGNNFTIHVSTTQYTTTINIIFTSTEGTFFSWSHRIGKKVTRTFLTNSLVVFQWIKISRLSLRKWLGRFYELISRACVPVKYELNFLGAFLLVLHHDQH